MSTKSFALSAELAEYILKVSLRENPILNQLRIETSKHPLARMQIAPEQGQLMALLVKLMQASKILEIGVFTGYSSLCMALALPPDGNIVACDKSEEFTDIAKRYWKEAGVENKIELKIAPALQTLDEFIKAGKTEFFDMAFIDADKSNYLAYYEKCLQLVRKGGLIMVDNVLWRGDILNSETQDKNSQYIQAFNQKLAEDQNIDLVVLPIADGLTLALKK